MFNLIDLKEGDKVDFWLLTNETFDKSRFHVNVKKNLWDWKWRFPALKILYWLN